MTNYHLETLSQTIVIYLHVLEKLILIIVKIKITQILKLLNENLFSIFFYFNILILPNTVIDLTRPIFGCSLHVQYTPFKSAMHIDIHGKFPGPKYIHVIYIFSTSIFSYCYSIWNRALLISRNQSLNHI